MNNIPPRELVIKAGYLWNMEQESEGHKHLEWKL